MFVLQTRELSTGTWERTRAHFDADTGKWLDDVTEPGLYRFATDALEARDDYLRENDPGRTGLPYKARVVEQASGRIVEYELADA